MLCELFETLNKVANFLKVGNSFLTIEVFYQ